MAKTYKQATKIGHRGFGKAKHAPVKGELQVTQRLR